MQLKMFTISLAPDEQQTEEINHFLRSHKIIDVRKEIAVQNGNSVWTFCVSYLLDSKPSQSLQNKNVKIDYKDVLDEVAFNTFSRLRKVRKAIADEEAVPAYAIFTDAELAELAKQKKLSLTVIQAVPGIGKKKVEKYGSRMIDEMNKKTDETSGQSDRTNS